MTASLGEVIPNEKERYLIGSSLKDLGIRLTTAMRAIKETRFLDKAYKMDLKVK